MTPGELIAAFEVIAEAEDGVKRLRELVLQLAVRGRLVPQDPEDEPATTSLGRAQSIAQASRGPRQRPRDFSPVEGPYELPANWRWTRLSDIANYNGRPNAEPDQIAPTTWLLDLEDIEKVTSRVLQRSTFAARNSRSTKSTFEVGDVLYGKLRPYLDKVVVADQPGVCTTEIVPVVPFECVSSAWLRLSMKRPDFVRHVEALSYGVKMPRLGTDDANASLHPLPPLAEQHRIVARVDELMALLDRLEAARLVREQVRRAARDAALAALREAEDAAAVEMAWGRVADHFVTLVPSAEVVAAIRDCLVDLAVTGRLVVGVPSDAHAGAVIEEARQRKVASDPRWVGPASLPESRRPYSLPERWEWTTFDGLCWIVSGVTKGRQFDGTTLVGVPYLRVANVQAGFLKLDVVKSIEVPADEVDMYSLRVGDILLTEGGDWDKLGRSAVWNGEIDPCIHQNHVFRARLASSQVLPRWLSLFTNSGAGRRYFQSCAKQTTNLASINMRQLRACPVPLPPLAEQHRIVAKVDELMSLCDALEARLTVAADLQARFAAAAVHHLDA